MKKIPIWIYVFWIIFLFATIYLGEIKNFYYHIPYWDNILHVSSGMMLVVSATYFFEIIICKEKLVDNKKLTCVIIFALTFAIASGAIWEIYEYVADGILRLNMQKFAMENGVSLIGREALKDTMQDLIFDAIGALIASVGMYYIKSKKN